MNIDAYFNNMELDFIALESTILNFETVYDIYGTEQRGAPVSLAAESTDYVFGTDLFTDAIAAESISTPAMEGIGEKIKSALKSIINAIKNFFLSLGRFIKRLFGIKQDTKHPLKPPKKDSEEYKKITDKIDSSWDKISAIEVAVLVQINNFNISEGKSLKLISAEINKYIKFNDMKAFNNWMDDGRDSKETLTRHQLETTGQRMRDGIKDVDKTISKWRDSQKGADTKAAAIEDAYKKLCVGAKETINSLVSVWGDLEGRHQDDRTQYDNDEKSREVRKIVIEAFTKSHTNNAKVMTKIDDSLKEIEKICDENRLECDSMLKSDIFSSDEHDPKNLKSQNQQTAFQMCKIYLANSQTVGRVSKILMKIKQLSFLKNSDYE